MLEGKFYQTARDNEQVFREILEDLKNNRDHRTCGIYIPPDLKTDLPLEEIFKQYSEGDRQGKFEITNFTRRENRATIGFRNVLFISGGGAELAYFVKDNKVTFEGTVCSWKN